ncbi:c-type cytochrome [Pseudalkalibacillus sp. JSM 102089]|uniref:c-type cytochrome n=1 Tax=Pseudalkalibacillus sp. JSM 102089 TaxID=3229856 RepID=UPI003524E9CA
MKKWIGFLFVVVLIFSLAACGASNNENSTNDGSSKESNSENENGGQASGEYDANAAEATYQTNCLSCHGDNLEGKVGPQLSNVGSRLSKDEILSVIQNGTGQMPGNILRGDTEVEENVASWLADMK